eukprot:CAMPEP_0194417892 /NCGR_PEP_ID=MMETSP0176-20130528/16950_1 /TAXON_ID=216777 /ORGANISM="Proboscia alata, Strain PI-D3" /LENGTH=65 /DNA_ID=CAMNT_0039223993 /DNA_START=62 /DNA_END=256 /DNA_ORIENTATION=+
MKLIPSMTPNVLPISAGMVMKRSGSFASLFLAQNRPHTGTERAVKKGSHCYACVVANRNDLDAVR